MRRRFTSESVTEGHPDKICDQISDAVLDEVMRHDPQGRVACETYTTIGIVLVGGEMSTRCWVNLPKVVHGVLRKIGYTDAQSGINANSCAIVDTIRKQSPDIAQGVDSGGAGDQGVMFGYATRETEEFMPLPIVLAHRMVVRLAEVRKKGILPYLRPDGKSQVTVEYENGIPVRVDSAVIAAQHDERILDHTGRRITKAARQEIIDTVIREAIPSQFLDRRTKFFVNQTGKFVVGGPESDTGMTGRKIVADTYGGWVRHGGGAFSGKDPTKVDRSATYTARYIAKNCVAAGLCERIEVRLAYVIGRADPTELSVDTFGTGLIDERKLVRLVREVFPLKPKDMIRRLKLRKPIYLPTACCGHFGRIPAKVKDAETGKIIEYFTWEKLDMVNRLRRALK
ncbi:methionine adenosyltransferase [candidate division WOR-3 bacterium JGI_Cruoil_03_51_56]|uniref:S-adenosylmethionine synthase n=1 Tax=candidate division WOR-3 bacterium JGI_Cruoil_03_51_56 TaxID=1973747 RepID=A0A235BUX6_UNCW3|nr:MAG: methionine adenosyltransferase [candidate division WOR-3 bacterium JGI_Cruoil_03_51_56]